MANPTGDELERLQAIMGRLRAPGGCPWDREQDLRSLRPYLVEEAFEVLEEMDAAVYQGKWGSLCEELGDLLFQIVFHAQLASERGHFTLADVCRTIAEKIERRHPHVFGEARVSGATEVLHNWAKLKAEEKRRKQGGVGSVLDGVPAGAPALLRAERLTEKASRIGFDWPDLAGVRAKLTEELAELDEAVASRNRDRIEHELGDVLFCLANLARFLKTPAEDALRQAIVRFVSRFHQIERGLEAAAVPFGEATLEQMERLWQEAKAGEASLPRPTRQTPPASTIVSLAVRDPVAEANFWKRLGPVLGWTVEAEAPVRVSDGLLSFAFVPGEAGAGTQISIPVYSALALAELERAAASWPGVAVTRSNFEAAPSVTLRSPSGLDWTFGLRTLFST